MKKFFKKKPVKVILGVLIALTVVFSACNLYFGAVAREEQKGVAVCDELSTKDKYTDDYAQKLEIGDKDAKILLLTDIHIRNHGTFAACLGVNYILDGIEKESGKRVLNMAFTHVPLPEYKELNGDFELGMRQEDTFSARVNDGFFEAFKENGGTHVFVAHDHNNNFVANYEGVKLCYMTKSSYNCYFSTKTPGGTLLTLDKDNNVNIQIESFTIKTEQTKFFMPPFMKEPSN